MCKKSQNLTKNWLRSCFGRFGFGPYYGISIEIFMVSVLWQKFSFGHTLASRETTLPGNFNEKSCDRKPMTNVKGIVKDSS